MAVPSKPSAVDQAQKVVDAIDALFDESAKLYSADVIDFDKLTDAEKQLRLAWLSFYRYHAWAAQQK